MGCAMDIEIPERLEAVFTSNSDRKIKKIKKLWNSVNSLIENTKENLSKSPEFFPNYTIHGVPHINTVLEYADKLIPDDTLNKILKPYDVAYLICAVILHDLGMFLSKASVRKLLSDDYPIDPIKELKDQAWREEWNAYLNHIKRYSREELEYNFGIRELDKLPDIMSDNLSDVDKLIIGEFLRRHHPRIAHEIAIGSLLGDKNQDVFQGTGFNQDDRKLIGMLARSHGMYIRETEAYVKSIRDVYHDPLYYLMCVLRLADYLDAGTDRAPESIRHLYGINVPISGKEWDWNQAIYEDQSNWDNGQRYIHAVPKTTTIFVLLEKWLNGVQNELNMCWGVITTKYPTESYRLSVYGITSNILKNNKRKELSQEFVTREARLKADAELLNLLVGPLYQNDPSCGVRELIQNAVDACNERIHLAKETNYNAQVEVRLDTIAKTLTVKDNGIGMDENVILNYYLTAGVSYRDSDEWLRTYATDRDPNIIRVGHFGVGVLATFLLGDEVEVLTWPIKEDLGYRFKFTLKPKLLDIKRVKKTDLDLSNSDPNPIGTTITVTLKSDALQKLLDDYDPSEKTGGNKTWMNWYRFDNPSVEFWVNGVKVEEKQHKQGTSYVGCVPKTNGEISGWYDLKVTEEDELTEKKKYEAVLWGYPHDGFFCNGIRIPYGMRESYAYDDITILSPSVSVINKNSADPNIRLPLDISRRFLADFPPLKALGREIARYTMAQLLAADCTSREDAVKHWEEGIPYVLSTGSEKPAPIVYGSDGYTLMHIQFLGRSKTKGTPLENRKRYLIFYVKKDALLDEMAALIQNVAPKIPFIILREDIDPDKELDVQQILESIYEPPFGKEYYNTEFCRVYLHKELITNQPSEELLTKKSLKKEPDIEEFCKYEHKPDLEKYPDKQPTGPNFNEACLDASICLAVGEILCGPSDYYKTKLLGDGKNNLWNFVKESMKGDPWIPYDKTTRCSRIPKAFRELNDYIPDE